MWMQSPPVNSLNLDLLTEFTTTLEKLEMDKSCRGVIITSVGPHALQTGNTCSTSLSSWVVPSWQLLF